MMIKVKDLQQKGSFMSFLGKYYVLSNEMLLEEKLSRFSWFVYSSSLDLSNGPSPEKLEIENMQERGISRLLLRRHRNLIRKDKL